MGLLAQGKFTGDLLDAEMGEVDEKAAKKIGTHTDFYNNLHLFDDIDAVEITWQCGDRKPVCREVEIPDLWRKSWAAQLSACKTLQWLIATTTATIRKSRRIKTDEGACD